MTAADAFWLRVNRRAAGLSPDIAATLLAAFALIRQGIGGPILLAMFANGDVEGALRTILSDSVLANAFFRVRDQIRNDTGDAVTYFARDIPGIASQIMIGFDILNPTVIDAIRSLESKVIDGLIDSVRETVRAYVEQGLRLGINPRQMAVQMRGIVGLSPNQLAAIENYRTLLASLDREALTRALRDRRFDRTIRNAIKNGTPLTPAQLEAQVEAYRKRMIAFQTETIARTAALDSLKLGQRLAWQDAIDKGIVDGDRVRKRWKGVMDARERPAHVAMEKETQRFDDPFSNGEMIPGDSTYNCRCVAIYFVAPLKS